MSLTGATRSWRGLLLILAISCTSAYSSKPEIHYKPGVVPGLIYGTAWKKDRTADLLLKAFRLGFRAFDTAAHPRHYEEADCAEALLLAEQQLGIKREDLWIQTKFTPDACDGIEPEKHPYEPEATTTDQVRQSYSSSLLRLNVKYFDSYVLHGPYPDSAKTLEAYREMEKIQKEVGDQMVLGVSNFNLQQLMQLWEEAEVKPTHVQNRCFVGNGYDREVRDFCTEKGIHYQGFWLLTGNRDASASPVAREIANARSKTVEQIMYRYFFQSDIIVLSGTSTDQHISEALEINDFELTADEMAQLAEVPKFTVRDRVDAHIENVMPTEVELFWRNCTGHDVSNRMIPAGETTDVETFHSHTWLAKLPGGDAPVFHWEADRAHGDNQHLRVDGQVEVRFTNVGDEPLSVFWVGSDDTEEIPQGELPAGGELERQSQFGHIFHVRNAKQELVSKYQAQVQVPGTQFVPVGPLKDEL